MNTDMPVKFLYASGFAGSNAEKIAYKMTSGRGPAIIWCGGLKSDMEGSKALHLHQWAKNEGRTFIRFDYFGHGQSTGRFRDGTMSRWAQDILTVMEAFVEGEAILVGSSMGGWASLLAAMDRKENVKGLVLIAPAPDFTEKLMWENFDEAARRAVIEDGIHYEPSEYDEPYEYSRELIEDGRSRQILDGPIDFDGPVRILQGIQDTVVPWEHAQRLIEVLTSNDVTMTLVKAGDHSLSQPEDLKRLTTAVDDVCKRLER